MISNYHVIHEDPNSIYRASREVTSTSLKNIRTNEANFQADSAKMNNGDDAGDGTAQEEFLTFSTKIDQLIGTMTQISSVMDRGYAWSRHSESDSYDDDDNDDTQMLDEDGDAETKVDDEDHDDDNSMTSSSKPRPIPRHLNGLMALLTRANKEANAATLYFKTSLKKDFNQLYDENVIELSHDFEEVSEIYEDIEGNAKYFRGSMDKLLQRMMDTVQNLSVMVYVALKAFSPARGLSGGGRDDDNDDATVVRFRTPHHPSFRPFDRKYTL